MKKLALILSLAFAASACGVQYNTAERPTVQEFADAIAVADAAEGDVIPADAEVCMAELFVNSDLSSNYLAAAVENPLSDQVFGVFDPADEDIVLDITSQIIPTCFE